MSYTEFCGVPGRLGVAGMTKQGLIGAEGSSVAQCCRCGAAGNSNCGPRVWLFQREVMIGETWGHQVAPRFPRTGDP
jgi:hypothetical protein